MTRAQNITRKLSLAGALLLLFSASGSVQGQARVIGERPDCVHATALARYGAMAYDHWVHLENTCSRPVHCSVSTDVNPMPSELDLPAGAVRDLNTFHGSAASAFVATVSCPVD